jgi:hypothetical protein
MNLPTNITPITVSLSFSTFIRHYIKAKKTFCEDSISKLLVALDFQFQSWNRMFIEDDLSSDITIATLFKLLEMDTKPKDTLVNKVVCLKSFLHENALSFYDLCVECFLLHIQKKTIIYNDYKKELRFFFYLSKEIKMFLFKKIRYILQKAKSDFFTNPSDRQLCEKYTTYYFDETHLNALSTQNPLLYSAYIFFLSTSLKNEKALKEKYNLTIKQSKKLKEDLCQLIKTLLSSN